MYGILKFSLKFFQHTAGNLTEWAFIKGLFQGILCNLLEKLSCRTALYASRISQITLPT